MVDVKQLRDTQQQILKKIANAAQKGDVQILSSLSNAAASYDSLIKEQVDLDSRVAHLVDAVRNQAQATTPATAARPGAGTSPKRAAAAVRAKWVEGVGGHGIQLKGHRKRFHTAEGESVGIAFANELDGMPNKWFLGLVDEPTDVAVLLCRAATGKIYDVVLPVTALGKGWKILSRSNGQIKFNIRKEVTDFYLSIPGNKPVMITEYVGNYAPLGPR